MNDALIRGQILHALHAFCSLPAFLKPLDENRAQIGQELPLHRLNQIATSLAWHASRPAAPERLLEATREITRLWDRSGRGEAGEARFYMFLAERLGLNRELARLADQVEKDLDEIKSTINAVTDERERRRLTREKEAQQKVLKKQKSLYEALSKQLPEPTRGDGTWDGAIQQGIGLTQQESARWNDEIRLRLAIASIQAFQALQNTNQLQKQIEKQLEPMKGIFPWR
jgi:hypothetical protein